jgi:alpha-beta hydrolase superfamily lysophospholipase
MSQLIKVAGWSEKPRAAVVFIHGLGGHPYDTWRRTPKNHTFWPLWLAKDVPGLAVWTLAFEAPASNWLGTAMPLQDRAKNILEHLVGERELRGLPIVFVCHSLGGLLIKQVLRAADGRRVYGDAEARAFLESVRGVVFIATPHSGAVHATLLDKLRLIAWPSASALDLVKSNASLRDLNVWYRNWSTAIRHKVFYEKQATSAGVIVAEDSSDPGLLHVDPVSIDADHLAICKPADTRNLVYSRTRDFVADTIGQDTGRDHGAFLSLDLPELARQRSNRIVPIALRLAMLLIFCLVFFTGLRQLFFPADPLSMATVAQIKSALHDRWPPLTTTQIDQFVQSLRRLRGDPSFTQAVEEARKGNTRIAECLACSARRSIKRQESWRKRASSIVAVDTFGLSDASNSNGTPANATAISTATSRACLQCPVSACPGAWSRLPVRTWGITGLWALDFCERRASDCMQIAEECEDAPRRRAWLELAQEWVKLSEEVLASNHGKLRRNIFNEPQAEKQSCSQLSEDRPGVLPVGAGGEGPA